MFYFRLRNIHEIDFTHQDLHSGNILHLESNLNKSFQIANLGLAQPENIPNDEINGVIPYIAPEIFIGSKFSKASDVYSPIRNLYIEMIYFVYILYMFL